MWFAASIRRFLHTARQARVRRTLCLDSIGTIMQTLARTHLAVWGSMVISTASSMIKPSLESFHVLLRWFLVNLNRNTTARWRLVTQKLAQMTTLFIAHSYKYTTRSYSIYSRIDMVRSLWTSERTSMRAFSSRVRASMPWQTPQIASHF